MTTPTNPRLLLAHASALATQEGCDLLSALERLGVSRAEAQATINVALAAGIPCQAFERPRSGDDLEAAAWLDPATQAHEGRLDAARYLDHAGAALTAYGEHFDPRERQDVVAFLEAAAVAAGLDEAGGDVELASRYRSLQTELATLDEEARAAEQGWMAAG